MNKEERVNLMFETISKIAGFEIKPDKEFYIVENDKRVAYLIDEFLNLLYKKPDGYFGSSDYGILPILKGGYRLEEIKEPLLTDEERDFLRQFKFEELEVTDKINLYLYDNGMRVAIINLKTLNFGFVGLKEGKKYFKAELWL